MRYLCRFDPNEQFCISQISLSRDSRQLIVAISQAAKLSKKQPRSHLRLEHLRGGGRAKGHSLTLETNCLTLETNCLGYAPRLKRNMSLANQTSWMAMRARTNAVGDGERSRQFL